VREPDVGCFGSEVQDREERKEFAKVAKEFDAEPRRISRPVSESAGPRNEANLGVAETGN